MNNIKYILSLIIGFCCTLPVLAQETETDPEQEKALRRSTNLTWEANKELSENDFVGAEADYRRAISKSTENIAAPYNLGNAYLYRIQEDRADNLERALAACTAALEVRTRQALPQDWAATQNDLGNA